MVLQASKLRFRRISDPSLTNTEAQNRELKFMEMRRTVQGSRIGGISLDVPIFILKIPHKFK